jgi:hypothetical protein
LFFGKTSFPCSVRDSQQSLNRKIKRSRNEFWLWPACLDWKPKADKRVPHVAIHVQRIELDTARVGVLSKSPPETAGFFMVIDTGAAQSVKHGDPVLSRAAMTLLSSHPASRSSFCIFGHCAPKVWRAN